jgi:acyl carrier protein
VNSTQKQKMPDPFEVVAGALSQPVGSLSADSAMYKVHGWDSLGHLKVVLAIEKALGVSITEAEVIDFCTMRKVVEFFDRHRGDVSP